MDSQLRVYGESDLRVADASIFPQAPRGNTQSMMYAVAEKAVTLIKAWMSPSIEMKKSKKRMEPEALR